MRNIKGYKLNKSLISFKEVRDVLDEKMYMVLKSLINDKFTTEEDFIELLSDTYKTILDDGKVRKLIESLSNKPMCILYVHETGNYIQFFNFDLFYKDIEHVLMSSGCIEEYNYIEGVSEIEECDVWKEIFDNFERTPVDSGFIINMLSEKILNKLVEYLYRKHYEIKNKNPES